MNYIKKYGKPLFFIGLKIDIKNKNLTDETDALNTMRVYSTLYDILEEKISTHQMLVTDKYLVLKGSLVIDYLNFFKKKNHTNWEIKFKGDYVLYIDEYLNKLANGIVDKVTGDKTLEVSEFSIKNSEDNSLMTLLIKEGELYLKEPFN